ncbi:MAG: hypothetical protein AB1665_08145, partial [Candidatus Thermoplasmatota archaeon]
AVFDNGVEISGYTIELDSGLIIFDSPLQPGASITANYTHYSHVITVPVLINVGASVLNFTFGGDSANNLFNNNVIGGGYDKAMDDNGALITPYAGDWRFYYVAVPDRGLFHSGEGIYMYINAYWAAKPTDNDIFVFGSSGSDKPTSEDGDRFGPYTLENIGGSEEMDGSTFYTNTNGPQETVALKLVPGLNVIAVHNVILRGMSHEEEIMGEVGWISLSHTQITETTNIPYGSVSVNMYSNQAINGTNATVLGPATSEIYKDLEVWQEKPSDMAAQDAAVSWRDYVYTYRLSSFQMTYQVERAATFEVHIIGNPADDLDFGIFYDHNLNGKIELEDLIDSSFCEFICYNTWGAAPYAVGADADGDERVKLIAPPDGQYIIAVYGWGVKTGGVEGEGAPAHFNMEISMIVAGVAGYGLEGAPGDDLSPDLSTYENDHMVDPFTTMTYSVTWDFPGSAVDGVYGGVMYIGTRDAPGLVSVLVNIVIDRSAPIISSNLKPSDGSIINDAQPQIMAEIEDSSRGEIDAHSIRISLDGEDITFASSVLVPFIEGAGSGNPTAIVSYQPLQALADGGHRVAVSAADWAGNTVTNSWVFTVDRNAPEITLHTPTESGVVTGADAISIEGTTDPTASLTILSGTIEVPAFLDESGTFRANVPLSEGRNEIKMEATDPAGNMGRIVLTVVRDLSMPTISSVVSSAGTLTNTGWTDISGEVSGAGTLTVNGKPATLQSDRSFQETVMLQQEGLNPIQIEFTDLKGDTAVVWRNVTRDTLPPSIELQEVPTKTNIGSITVSGSTEPGASVWVNGKLVIPDEDGEFTEEGIALSYGVNNLVVQGRDAAGNMAEKRIALSYEPAWGVNYAAIGLMAALLIIGLLVGALVIFFLRRPPAEPVPPEEAIPEEVPPIPPEEAVPEVPEAEEMPPIPPEEAIPEMPAEEAAEEVVPEEVPPTEVAPEEVPKEEAPAEKAEIPPTDVAPEEEVPVEVKEEEIPPPEEMEPKPIEKDTVLPPKEPAPAPPSLSVEEKIARLDKAYKDGKISKEMYELNLRKLKGE